MSNAAPPDDVVPAEIFLDPEDAARRRDQRKRHGHTVTIPRLRIIGFTLSVLLGVPLHNAAITQDFSFSTFLTFLLIVGLYSTASWVLLWSLYDRIDSFDLGDAFLHADLVVLALAVYVTGGEQSWFFGLPLMRVAG